jgi:hypothetical protein
VVVAVLGVLDLGVDDAQELGVGGGPGREHRRERHCARLRPRHDGGEGAEKRGAAGCARGCGAEEGCGGGRGAAGGGVEGHGEGGGGGECRFTRVLEVRDGEGFRMLKMSGVYFSGRGTVLLAKEERNWPFTTPSKINGRKNFVRLEKRTQFSFI